MSAQPDTALLDRLIAERLDALLPKKLAELRERQTPSMTIIATKGTLDWAYPPFILSSTAAALGWDVSVFFTFYGLNLLKKDLSGLKVSPLGNPGMPMKMPFGPDWFKGINWNIPNAVQAVVPGFETMATTLAAAYMNIPIAHTMGGEVSGTIDESIRHAVTKFAHIHFPACSEARERIIRMGERPEDVHLVGCPRLDLVAGRAVCEGVAREPAAT